MYVCVYCSTSPRASQRQSVLSATELRVQATTQAAECQPAPTTLPLPHMLLGRHAHAHADADEHVYIGQHSMFSILNLSFNKNPTVFIGTCFFCRK